MKIVKIRSKKHPGAIFLKVLGTKEDFLCKVYSNDDTEKRADTIIKAFEEKDNDFLGFDEENLDLLVQGIKDIYRGLLYLEIADQGKIIGVDFDIGKSKINKALCNLGR